MNKRRKIILELLSTSPMTGSEMLSRSNKLGKKHIAATLRYMRVEGWVTNDDNVFSITAKGREYLSTALQGV